MGVAIADITAGLFATTAILAALHERTQSGRGQYIDVALLDAQIAWLANVAQNYLATGETPARYGNAHPSIVPYETFPTRDGYIAVGVGTDAQYRKLCELAGRPDLGEDERFRTNQARVAQRTTLIPLLQEIFRTRTAAEWLAGLRELGVPAGPINDVATALRRPAGARRAAWCRRWSIRRRGGSRCWARWQSFRARRPRCACRRRRWASTRTRCWRRCWGWTTGKSPDCGRTR